MIQAASSQSICLLCRYPGSLCSASIWACEPSQQMRRRDFMRIDAAPRTRGSYFRSALALLALTPLLGACNLDTLLETKDPFTVTPPVARDTANLETLYAGARSEFALAFGGQQNTEGGIVMVTGLMSDELYSS